jgi:hypothetical protein
VNQQGNEPQLSASESTRLKEDLEESGYAILRNVVPKGPLRELNDRLIEAYESSEKFEGGGTIVGHLNCFPGESARFVYDALHDYGIVGAVLALREGKSNEILSRVNWNLPDSSAQHYHMDSAFANDWIICNIAIVDVNPENGPMDVLPGTHREFYPYWRFALERKAKLSTLLAMEQGDVLVRTSNLWHRGTPNRTKAARPLMSLTFGEPSAREGDPFVLNGSGITFYPNWYGNATRKDILRERIEKALPVTRSAGRFVKSIVRPHGYDGY